MTSSKVSPTKENRGTLSSPIIHAEPILDTVEGADFENIMKERNRVSANHPAVFFFCFSYCVRLRSFHSSFCGE